MFNNFFPAAILPGSFGFVYFTVDVTEAASVTFVSGATKGCAKDFY